MIIYISISKCRSDSYAPSFHRETFFVHAQNGRKDFFCEASFHYKVYAIHFQCVCDNDRMVFTLIYEKLIKLMIYHITISIYVILLIHLTKKNGIFCLLHVYHLASNIILTNIPLPVLSIISVLWCIYLDRGYIFKDIDFKFNMIDISKKLRLQGKRKLNSTCRRLFLTNRWKDDNIQFFLTKDVMIFCNSEITLIYCRSKIIMIHVLI